ncbi:hypothetical protein TNCV_1658821 [Trichonephila clavipes]|nr:hypothetical protein TNCV_1658821 [Trichonephila clavipes]
MEVTTHTHSRGDAFSQSLQTKSVSTSKQRRKRGLGIKNGQDSDDIGDKRHPREEAPPSHHQFHSKNRKRQQKTGDPEGIARTRYPPKLNKTKIPTIHLFFKVGFFRTFTGFSTRFCTFPDRHYSELLGPPNHDLGGPPYTFPISKNDRAGEDCV